PKSASRITVITFNSTYNHALCSNTAIYAPKYQNILQDALDKIQFFTQYGNLLIGT
ncbi:40932_t:CDS:1, partial [Gigaspora margarita]